MATGGVIEMREDGGAEWPMHSRTTEMKEGYRLQLIEEQVMFRRVREMGLALRGGKVDMERLQIGVHDLTFPMNP